MRILLVEDETGPIDAVREELGIAKVRASITEAHSRDSAISELARGEFDVVICDLILPTTDGALDLQDRHGVFVIRETVANHPTSKVLVLSGFGTFDNLGDVVNRPERDLYGTGRPEPVVLHTSKKDYSVCVTELVRIKSELKALEEIEVVSHALRLSPGDKRALQVYARSREGKLVRVEPGAPGLSGALTLRITFDDRSGLQRGAAFVKVDGREAVEDEGSRFQRHVAGSLPPGNHAPLTATIVAEAGRSALFYGLVSGPVESLFELLSHDEGRASRIVSEMRVVEDQSWLHGAPSRPTTVQEIRIARGGQESLMRRHLAGLDWRGFEANRLQIREGIQHGDMHGENVMIDGLGRWFFVDFAHTGPAVASLDAVQLELSLVFHPSGRAAVGDWPSPSQLATWPDLETFASACPVPAFLRATRSWALANGAGDRAVLANAYGHVVKQLAYPKIDPARVRALVRAIMDAW